MVIEEIRTKVRSIVRSTNPVKEPMEKGNEVHVEQREEERSPVVDLEAQPTPLKVDMGPHAQSDEVELVDSNQLGSQQGSRH